MKFYTFAILVSHATISGGFQPRTVVSNHVVQKPSPLEMGTRREVLAEIGIATAASLIVPNKMARAFSQQLDDFAFEPAQQATDGKLDLNAAFVGDYKQLRGMFPTAAGKIASHGPYKTVKDIYKIPDLTARDKDLFKQYEKEFTVHPPGRTFDERINARVST